MTNMRIILSSLILLFLCHVDLFSQKLLKACDIIKDIKRGKDVKYQDCIIEGKLDFTYMDDRNLADSWWNRYWNGKFEKRGVIKEQIKSSIQFFNCTFKDDVLAYVRLGDQNYTLIANFSESIIFQNCTFEASAMFKHSDFNETVSFAQSTFNGATTFKYCEFVKSVDFSGTEWKKDATFKYALLKSGLRLDGAKFQKSLNIKYLRVYGPLSTKDLQVIDGINAEHSVINERTLLDYLFYSNVKTN